MMSIHFVWEFEVIKWLQQQSSKFTDFFFNVSSLFGEELILIMIVAVIFWCINKRQGEYIAFSMMSTIAINTILKNIFLARRPFEYTEHGIINKRPNTATGTSFPSGHSQSAATTYTSIYLAFRKKFLLYLAIIITFLVAFSRINLGVHFITDVVVGGTLGVFVAIGAYKLFDTFENQKFLIYLIMAVALIPILFIIQDKAIFMGAGLFFGYVGGIYFENKVVNFSTDVGLLEKIIRIIIGIIILYALKEGLKLIFPDHNTFHLVRYGLISYVGIGLYPLSFNWLHKIVAKTKRRSD